MKPNMYAAQNSGQKAWNRLLTGAPARKTCCFARQTIGGRINAAPLYAETERTIRARLSAYQEMMAKAAHHERISSRGEFSRGRKWGGCSKKPTGSGWPG